MLRPLATLILLLLLICPDASALEIRLKEQAQVRGRMVTLGEIAELSPSDAGTRALAALVLFPAPDPGEQTVVKAKEIARHFARRALGEDEPRWSGADQVTIRREGIVIGPEKIEQILREFLSRNKSLLPQAKVGIKSLNSLRPFVLPPGKLDYEVIPSDPRILGSQRFTLIFRVDGQVEQNLALRVELEALAPVVVAAGDLARGVVLSAQDLNVVEMDLVGLKNPCFDPAELIGQKVKRSMRLGTPVDRSMVDFPPMIRRGDRVTITLRKGGLELNATGEARQDGKEGESIRIRNSSSRKEILCRVIAPGTAEVEF